MAIDSKLKECFRQESSCAAQVATLRIILDQSIKWDSTVKINVVDLVTAFDRETMWKLMRHYEIPKKLIS